MHTMIDLETMGTGSASAIVSIGAVEFDPNTFKLGREFYRVIDLQSCIDSGLAVEGSTVMWWLSQSEEARNALVTGIKTPLHEALQAFTEWLDPNTYVWSHGASFDLPILANAYAVGVGQVKPWKYNRELDTRTILWLTGQKMPPSVGTAHNALDDAKTQALGIVAALETLGDFK